MVPLTRVFWLAGLGLPLALLLPTVGAQGPVRLGPPAPPTGWEPVGLSGGGGLFTPAISPVDPDLMLINCDMSAAYLSEDGGRSWRMIHHAQLRSDTRCRPAFHPTDVDRIYASSGGRLALSRDRGRTFARLGDLSEALAGEIAISPDDPDVMLAGTRPGRVWRSRDAGLTWTVCAGPTGTVLGFHVDRTRPGRALFAATDRGIWRSEDGGDTWAAAMQGLPAAAIQGFAGASRAADGLVMLYCSVRSTVADSVRQGGIYRSRDRGETWQSAMGNGLNLGTEKVDQWGAGPVAQYRQLLAADAAPLTVYACNTSTGFHPPHHETVYRSDDGGEHWRATYFQDPRFARYNVAPTYVTASTGQSYKGGGTPFGVAICNRDPDRVLLVLTESHVTHDGGQSWLNGSIGPAPGETPRPGSAWAGNGQVITTTWHYYVDPHEPQRHTIAYTDIGLARSLDHGRTWIWWDRQSWPPWRNTCYEIAFDPNTPGLLWGAFSDVHDIPNDNIISERHGHQRPGGVAVSRDFGASWQVEATGLPPRPVTSIQLDPRSPPGRRTLYAGVFLEGVYKSSDGGRTWALKANGLGHPDNRRVSRVVLHTDGTLFAMICARRPGPGQPLRPEGVGLYRSRDGAETWESIYPAPPLLYPKDVTVHPGDSRHLLIGACDAGGQDRSGGLYRTTDGGQTWARLGREGPQTFGGTFHPRHEGWIYMTLTEGAPGPGLWLSRDDGRSWQPFADLPFSNIQRVEFDPAQPEAIYVTTFGGSVWRGPPAPPNP